MCFCSVKLHYTKHLAAANYIVTIIQYLVVADKAALEAQLKFMGFLRKKPSLTSFCLKSVSDS